MRYFDAVEILDAMETQDLYSGDEVRDWAHPTTRRVPAAVQPVGTVELTDRRDTTVTRWVVHCLPTPVNAASRVRWGGDVFEVDGDIGIHKRRGVDHHREFTIKRFQDE